MLEFLGVRRIGFGLSVPLPSFYKKPKKIKLREPEMRPSNPSEFDPEKMLKDVKTSRDYRTGHPELIKRYKELKESYQRVFPDRQLIETCIYRSPQAQREIYKSGRFGNPGPILTYCDGFNKKSNHNKFPSRALDCAVVINGKAIWDETYYYQIGALAKEVGLEWGGFWTKFVDFPHLQLPKEVE